MGGGSAFVGFSLSLSCRSGRAVGGWGGGGARRWRPPRVWPVLHFIASSPPPPLFQAHVQMVGRRAQKLGAPVVGRVPPPELGHVGHVAVERGGGRRFYGGGGLARAALSLPTAWRVARRGERGAAAGSGAQKRGGGTPPAAIAPAPSPLPSHRSPAAAAPCPPVARASARPAAAASMVCVLVGKGGGDRRRKKKVSDASASLRPFFVSRQPLAPLPHAHDHDLPVARAAR